MPNLGPSNKFAKNSRVSFQFQLPQVVALAVLFWYVARRGIPGMTG